ncbi:putative beta-D-xylosidase 7 [Salvia divinorum]|uniref:Beta-D-xylosidase 7 n=1 Tax=Salvia divinorum TaxID=28513 RepID=A0ABD1I0Q5_SALDI
MEREKLNRDELRLPGHQEDLITAATKAAVKPVVLVMLCGGLVDVSFAKRNTKIASILWAGYPGGVEGVALAQTLFGDNNPGGKLPVTWYPKEFSKVAMTDMRTRPDPSQGYPGGTYRFYTGPTVYEFGYRLSYSNYLQVHLSQPRQPLSQQFIGVKKSGLIFVSNPGSKGCKRIKFSAQVRVTNHGGMPVKERVKILDLISIQVKALAMLMKVGNWLLMRAPSKGVGDDERAINVVI